MKALCFHACGSFANGWSRFVRDLFGIFDGYVQPQGIVLLVAQPQVDSAGMQVLPDRPQHFTDKFLRRSFGGENIDAAHITST